jgi:phosphoglycolate phosphatase-like HAD superfamily hydrolase
MPMKVKAVIADVDGTLADVSTILHHVAKGRGTRDFHAFHTASAHVPPHRQALDFVERYHAAGHTILVVTARMQKYEQLTRTWLNQHLTVPFEGPFMRRNGDRRVDYIVKKEIHRYLARHFDIRAAIDDNPSIIELWKELGIPAETVPGWHAPAAGRPQAEAIGNN